MHSYFENKWHIYSVNNNNINNNNNNKLLWIEFDKWVSFLVFKYIYVWNK